jgi:Winged helix-turn helix
MPTTRRLVLTEEQRHQLTHLRDASPKPYLRERAAALLKIAQGMSAAQVAQQGLLRPRQPDTVYRWFNSFLAQGIEGLKVKPGAGRKPAFSPSATHPTSSSRRSALLGAAGPTSARTRQSQVDIGEH